MNKLTNSFKQNSGEYVREWDVGWGRGGIMVEGTTINGSPKWDQAALLDMKLRKDSRFNIESFTVFFFFLRCQGFV